MGLWLRNTEMGVPNDFDVEDIKGAAATIVIAGNDTVSLNMRCKIVPTRMLTCF